MGLYALELVMAVEEEFKVSIPNNVAPTLVRLGDLQDCAVQALRDAGLAADPADVWQRLKRVVVEEFLVPEESVVPGANLIDDLRLD